MCNPILIGAGLLAAGTGAQVIGNNQAKRAVRNTLEMERTRQNRMTEQQDAALASSMSSAQRLNDPAAQQGAMDRRKAAFIAALNTRAPDQGILPGMESAPAVVGEYGQQVNDASNAYSEQQAGALANLTAFGDNLFDTQVGIGRAGDTIGQLARDKARSAEILNPELMHAQSKGGTLRGLGGLAASIGGMVLGNGLFPGAGATGAGTTQNILNTAMKLRRVMTPSFALPVG